MGIFKKIKAVFTSKDDEIEQLEQQIERERKLLLRQRVARLRNLRERQKLQQEEEDLADELEEEDDEDDEEEELEVMPDSPEALLMGIVNKFLNKKMANSPQTAPVTQSPTSGAGAVNYSDEELRQIKKNSNPLIVKMAKGMSEENLRKKAKEYMPNADEDSINRAIKILKE